MNTLTITNNHSSASRKGRRMSKMARILLTVLGLLILLLGSGAMYQIIATRRDKQAYPPHTLLTNAGLPTPYVLVGHSAGGLHAQVCAGQYPAEVAGLVLIDPTPAQAINRFSPEQRRAVLPDSGQFQLLKVIQLLGLLRFLPPFDAPY